MRQIYRFLFVLYIIIYIVLSSTVIIPISYWIFTGLDWFKDDNFFDEFLENKI